MPGLIVTQHSGDGKANQYFLRGFNLDHGTDFATFVDGMPVNMVSHAHGQGYSDLNFVIPELIQRIDYRKGPYFASEGDFASAGSARLRLADTLPRGLGQFTLGRHGYRRGLLADSVALGGGTLLGALELQSNDGPWQQPETSASSTAGCAGASAAKAPRAAPPSWRTTPAGRPPTRSPKHGWRTARSTASAAWTRATAGARSASACQPSKPWRCPMAAGRRMPTPSARG